MPDFGNHGGSVRVEVVRSEYCSGGKSASGLPHLQLLVQPRGAVGEPQVYHHSRRLFLMSWAATYMTVFDAIDGLVIENVHDFHEMV